MRKLIVNNKCHHDTNSYMIEQLFNTQVLIKTKIHSLFYDKKEENRPWNENKNTEKCIKRGRVGANELRIQNEFILPCIYYLSLSKWNSDNS